MSYARRRWRTASVVSPRFRYSAAAARCGSTVRPPSRFPRHVQRLGHRFDDPLVAGALHPCDLERVAGLDGLLQLQIADAEAVVRLPVARTTVRDLGILLGRPFVIAVIVSEVGGRSNGFEGPARARRKKDDDQVCEDS